MLVGRRDLSGAEKVDHKVTHVVENVVWKDTRINAGCSERKNLTALGFRGSLPSRRKPPTRTTSAASTSFLAA